MDFMAKLHITKGGHDVILVILDRFTKIVYFLEANEKWYMEKLAKVYVNEIVKAHGVPLTIVLDRDSHFTSIFWRSLHEEICRKLCLSITYHPQIDGQRERTIQRLEYMLRIYTLDFMGNLDEIYHWSNFPKKIVTT